MNYLTKTLVAGAAMAALTVHAEGLYVGGNVGGSHYKGDAVGGLDTDRSGTGLKLYGGYGFTPNWALEAGYANLGKSNSAAGNVKADAAYLDGVGTVPLANKWSALGRVGVFSGNVKNSLAGSDRSTGYKYGAGLQYDLAANTALRGEWERYRFDAFGSKSNTDLYSVGVNWRF